MDKINYLLDLGFQSINLVRLTHPILNGGETILQKLYRKLFRKPTILNYSKAIDFFTGKEDFREEIIPSIIPNWDHSPRSGNKAYILHNSTPELFQKHVLDVLSSVKGKKDENQFIYLKSWNEWAEGNYMEPDLVYGKLYLDKLKDSLNSI